MINTQKKKPLMLNTNNEFSPDSIDEEDEYFPNGIFVFNITKMLKFINENLNEIELGEISVMEYREKSFNISEDHLE